MTYDEAIKWFWDLVQSSHGEFCTLDYETCCKAVAEQALIAIKKG